MSDYWSGLMEYEKTRTKNIRWMPPLRDGEFGYLIIDNEPCFINSWHTFDDYGCEMEIVEIVSRDGKTKEAYSDDGGETWRLEIF